MSTVCLRVILGFWLLSLIGPIQCLRENQTSIVHTKYGDVRGYQTDQARVFYGIPFAQPPINDLRWNSPVPIRPWAPQIINATTPAPACPQPKSHLPTILRPTVFSEDCLYLNVFTPLNTSSNLLPVMIFITGGNFQFLDASIPVYKSERFVNTSMVVCVFIQYRLGVLGFYATGNGPNDIKGNYGILDQRIAIAWIKANIDAFGGDPNQITIFGQSAGGQSAALHYLTADMQSFFQAVIVQSAPTTIPFRTYSEYVTPGVLLAEQLHCQYTDIACFRNATYEEIIAAQIVVNNMVTSFDFLLFFEPWTPVIDNLIIHGQLIDMIPNITFPLKPLMIGSVTEDALLFIYEAWTKPVTPVEYIEAAVASFRLDTLKVIEHFPPEGAGDQRPLLSKIATQWVFACTNRIFARQTGAYMYAFDYPLDFDGWENSTYCNGHTCHGVELPYLFESFWVNFTDTGRQLSTTMATYWTNFGKTMDPNRPVTQAVFWPKMTNTTEPYIYFQNPVQIKMDYLKDDCDFFDHLPHKLNIERKRHKNI